LANPLSAELGSNISGSSAFISVDNLVIPIQEWTNSNTVYANISEANTTLGVPQPIIFSLSFGGNASCTSICTVGTCFICNKQGNYISTVTNTGLGHYRLNGIDGTKLNCSGFGSTGSAPAWFFPPAGSSTSTYVYLEVVNAAFGNADAFMNVICHGSK
jgi:hypothetical protein